MSTEYCSSSVQKD